MKKLFQWALAAALICGASVFTSCTNDDNPVTPDLNLPEKIIGKWIEVEIDGQPAPNRGNSAVTFVSATKAYYSSSRPDYTETQLKWSAHREYNVKIEGNTVTLTGHPESEPELTLQEDFIITSITATEMVCKYRHTTIRDGKVSGQPVEKNARLQKTDVDYREAVVGTWEGQTSEGLNVRWQINADGTYVYARKVGDGGWETMVDEFNEYFADGYLFCARWKNFADGKGEQRQWWEIESIRDGVMKWKGLSRNADGPTYAETAELRKVADIDLSVSARIMGKWMKSEQNGQPLPTDGKMVYTFVSPTKAYMSASIDASADVGTHWVSRLEAEMSISGNKVSMTTYSEEGATMVVDYVVTAIDDASFTANHKVTITLGGAVVYVVEDVLRFVRVTVDYAPAILGTWECQEIMGGETYNDPNARLEFKADGTYRFYRKDEGGQWQAVTTREFQDYFVDGYLVNTRWKDAGATEQREWWEIASIADGQMEWTALRQRTDGTTFQQAVTWTKVE